MRSGNHER